MGRKRVSKMSITTIGGGCHGMGHFGGMHHHHGGMHMGGMHFGGCGMGHFGGFNVGGCGGFGGFGKSFSATSCGPMGCSSVSVGSTFSPCHSSVTSIKTKIG